MTNTEEAPLSRPRIWPVFAGFFGVFFGLQCLGVLALGVLVAMGGITSPADVERRILELTSSRGAILIGGLLTSGSMALVAALVGWLSRQGLAGRLRLARGRFRWGVTLVMLATLLALGQAADSAVTLLGWTGGGSLEMLTNAVAGARGLALLLAIVVLGLMAGTGEELFFRGFMQTRLRERLGPWPAIVITAVAFGIVHLDPLHSPLALLMGLFLGWVTELAGSIRPAMVLHVLNNTLWVVLSAFLDVSWPDQVHAVLVATMLPLGALLVALLRRWHAGFAPLEPPPPNIPGPDLVLTEERG